MKKFSFSTFFKKREISRGFTLIEMLVSIAIVAVVLTIILWNQNKFNGDLEITNVAYRVALTAREAQVYGISVRSSSFSGETLFSSAYGVHFFLGDEESLKSVLLFSDTHDENGNTPGDLKYNGNLGETTSVCPTGHDSECLSQLTLNRGNHLEKICVIHTNDSVVCMDSSGEGEYGEIRSADVLFKRPNPDAIIRLYDINGDPAGTPTDFTAIAFCLASPEAHQRQVLIYNTGQISIQDECINQNQPENGGNK